MKNFQFCIVSVLLPAVFLSCVKNGNSAFEKAGENVAGIINGVVAFKTTDSYLKATQNKNGEQQALIDKMRTEHFSSLSGKQGVADPAQRGNNGITNTFVPELYTNWLLQILNQDKICLINGYWIKVDMENGYCAALDATMYPDGYADLKNSVFANKHIMKFENNDEPVLEVLKGIRNGLFSWKAYRQQHLEKSGGGICSGAGTSVKYFSVPVYSGGALIMSIARYSKVYIHFELAGEGYVNGAGIYDDIMLTGKYEYEGLCQGIGAASFYLGPANNWAQSFVAYSGIAPLKVAKMEVTASSVNHGSGRMASIGY